MWYFWRFRKVFRWRFSPMYNDKSTFAKRMEAFETVNGSFAWNRKSCFWSLARTGMGGLLLALARQIWYFYILFSRLKEYFCTTGSGELLGGCAFIQEADCTPRRWNAWYRIAAGQMYRLDLVVHAAIMPPRTGWSVWIYGGTYWWSSFVRKLQGIYALDYEGWLVLDQE